jgi:hypothetical protein
MKRIISFLIVLVLLIMVATGCGNSDEAERLEEISLEMMRLNSERTELEREIELAWKEYDSTLSGGDCCFVLFFDNMTNNLMTKVYPLLTEYGYKGTVVMNDYQLPGGEGCITMDNYNTLVASGWDFAIGTGSVDLKGDNSVENLRAYLEEYKSLLSMQGLELPQTFAFAKNQYDEKYTDLLLEFGFKVVRYEGGDLGKYSYSIGRNGVYLLSTDIICADKTTMKADMQAAYKDKAAYSAYVRYIEDVVTDEDLDCTTVKYDLMLDFLEDDCEEAKILTASELYEYKANTIAGSSNYMEEFNKKIDDMENRLAEVNFRIEELRNSITTE